MRDENGEMVHKAHLRGFFSRICRLLFHRVRPVFVFDGATPALKKSTTLARRERREQQKSQMRKVAEKLLVNQLKKRALESAKAHKESQKKEKQATKTSQAKPSGSASASETEASTSSAAGTRPGQANSASASVSGVGMSGDASETVPRPSEGGPRQVGLSEAGPSRLQASSEAGPSNWRAFSEVGPSHLPGTSGRSRDEEPNATPWVRPHCNPMGAGTQRNQQLRPHCKNPLVRPHCNPLGATPLQPPCDPTATPWVRPHCNPRATPLQPPGCDHNCKPPLRTPLQTPLVRLPRNPRDREPMQPLGCDPLQPPCAPPICKPLDCVPPMTPVCDPTATPLGATPLQPPATHGNPPACDPTWQTPGAIPTATTRTTHTAHPRGRPHAHPCGPHCNTLGANPICNPRATSHCTIWDAPPTATPWVRTHATQSTHCKPMGATHCKTPVRPTATPGGPNATPTTETPLQPLVDPTATPRATPHPTATPLAVRPTANPRATPTLQPLGATPTPLPTPRDPTATPWLDPTATHVLRPHTSHHVGDPTATPWVTHPHCNPHGCDPTANPMGATTNATPWRCPIPTANTLGADPTANPRPTPLHTTCGATPTDNPRVATPLQPRATPLQPPGCDPTATPWVRPHCNPRPAVPIELESSDDEEEEAAWRAKGKAPVSLASQTQASGSGPALKMQDQEAFDEMVARELDSQLNPKKGSTITDEELMRLQDEELADVMGMEEMTMMKHRERGGGTMADDIDLRERLLSVSQSGATARLGSNTRSQTSAAGQVVEMFGGNGSSDEDSSSDDDEGQMADVSSSWFLRVGPIDSLQRANATGHHRIAYWISFEKRLESCFPLDSVFGVCQCLPTPECIACLISGGIEINAHDIDNIDAEVLATLPQSVQLEVLDKMKLAHQVANRERFLNAAAEKAETFSNVQMATYLKASAFRQKIESFKRGIGGAAIGPDGLRVQKIASEVGREFIFQKGHNNGKDKYGRNSNNDALVRDGGFMSAKEHQALAKGSRLSRANFLALSAPPLPPIQMPKLKTSINLAAFKGTSMSAAIEDVAVGGGGGAVREAMIVGGGSSLGANEVDAGGREAGHGFQPVKGCGAVREAMIVGGGSSLVANKVDAGGREARHGFQPVKVSVEVDLPKDHGSASEDSMFGGEDDDLFEDPDAPACGTESTMGFSSLLGLQMVQDQQVEGTESLMGFGSLLGLQMVQDQQVEGAPHERNGTGHT
eukprot:gene30426-35433_t